MYQSYHKNEKIHIFGKIIRIMKIKLSSLLFAVIVFSTTSCKRCTTCVLEKNGIRSEPSMCASGMGAADAISDFEKRMKEEDPDYVCKRD